MGHISEKDERDQKIFQVDKQKQVQEMISEFLDKDNEELNKVNTVEIDICKKVEFSVKNTKDEMPSDITHPHQQEATNTIETKKANEKALDKAGDPKKEQNENREKSKTVQVKEMIEEFLDSDDEESLESNPVSVRMAICKKEETNVESSKIADFESEKIQLESSTSETIEPTEVKLSGAQGLRDLIQKDKAGNMKHEENHNISNKQMSNTDKVFSRKKDDINTSSSQISTGIEPPINNLNNGGSVLKSDVNITHTDKESFLNDKQKMNNVSKVDDKMNADQHIPSKIDIITHDKIAENVVEMVQTESNVIMKSSTEEAKESTITLAKDEQNLSKDSDANKNEINSKSTTTKGSNKTVTKTEAITKENEVSYRGAEGMRSLLEDTKTNPYIHNSKPKTSSEGSEST